MIECIQPRRHKHGKRIFQAVHERLTHDIKAGIEQHRHLPVKLEKLRRLVHKSAGSIPF